MPISPGDVRRLLESESCQRQCLVLAERQGILGDRAWLVLMAGSTVIQHLYWGYLSDDENEAKHGVPEPPAAPELV